MKLGVCQQGFGLMLRATARGSWALKITGAAWTYCFDGWSSRTTYPSVKAIPGAYTAQFFGHLQRSEINGCQ